MNLKKRVNRKVQRFPARLSLHELNSQPAPDSYLVDISSLGAQLESPVFLALGSPVEFVLRFPWGDRETRLSGTVRWIRPLLGKPGCFRLGLSFYSTFWELDQMARQGRL
ncbi:MAG: PilZ domain-containing protein [Desulfobaccales bacterium]